MTEEEAWHAVAVFRERYEVIGWAEIKRQTVFWICCAY